ncbi:MAG: type II/IV secretion system ATPase subunit [Candidatus Thermoplasmatota archaeon]|nr:type II/IV secretion system ATPase subunit [Candidatus Thermoplasmatota archaeon]
MGAQAKITVLPELKDENLVVIEERAVTEHYTYTRLLYNKLLHEYLYEVTEPQLEDKELELLNFVKRKFIEEVSEGLYDKSEEERVELLKKEIDRIVEESELKVKKLCMEKIYYYCIRDFIGYGKIDVLMTDAMIEDISCDGANVPLYIYHRGYGSMKTNLVFEDDKELDRFVVALAQKCGKHISIASPMLDATIPDGSRLQATLAREVTTRGSTFTIRRFRANPLTPADLVKFGTMSAEMIAYCWLAVQYGESMLISGGTASGKTTTLNAILLFIPPQAKIVSIEDTREINIPHENWVAGLTRGGFRGKYAGTVGEIDMFELMKAALRQRPQYIIVGEVRGKEAYIIFQAMATGKATYSTIHADSVQAIVHRLENPPISLPRILVSALNIVLLQAQVKIGDKLCRKVTRIAEIVGIDPDTKELITNTIFEWEPGKDNFKYLGYSKLLDKIAYLRDISSEEVREELARRAEIIRWTVEKNISNYREIASIVNAYYKDPDAVIKKVREELYGKR